MLAGGSLVGSCMCVCVCSLVSFGRTGGRYGIHQDMVESADRKVVVVFRTKSKKRKRKRQRNDSSG